MILNDTTTICAVSTPHGMGGIAVIRVSGHEALDIVSKRWKGTPLDSMQSHTAHLGTILDSNGEILDQVVLTIFRAPASFTGEDVVELACHGSLWIQRQLVNTLIDAGCRAATAGEFTRRAFANGRMDLSQAEAVADVIAAQSQASHRVAMNQMRGAFSRQLADLRERLLHFVALIELELDFSEEDVTFADRSQLLELSASINHTIESLINSYRAGNVIKNGLPVAIVGQSNAGKSTLLNALLGDDKALVSDIKGTTRDVIEDSVVMDGVMLRFIDTAGIRESTDVIENMGIERSFRKMDEARIIMWVIDATEPATEVENFYRHLRDHVDGKALIAVVNKCDAAAGNDAGITGSLQSINTTTPLRQVPISALTGQGMDALKKMIVDMASIPGIADDNAVIVTNSRHYNALVRAQEALARAINGINANLSGDLLSQDIRECMHYLGEITGEITTHDILGEIFSHFCIGK